MIEAAVQPNWREIEGKFDALDVRCPECHAGKGFLCGVVVANTRSITGFSSDTFVRTLPNRYSHKDRWAAARGVALWLHDSLNKTGDV